MHTIYIVCLCVFNAVVCMNMRGLSLFVYTMTMCVLSVVLGNIDNLIIY